MNIIMIITHIEGGFTRNLALICRGLLWLSFWAMGLITQNLEALKLWIPVLLRIVIINRGNLHCLCVLIIQNILLLIFVAIILLYDTRFVHQGQIDGREGWNHILEAVSFLNQLVISLSQLADFLLWGILGRSQQVSLVVGELV